MSLLNTTHPGQLHREHCSAQKINVYSCILFPFTSYWATTILSSYPTAPSLLSKSIKTGFVARLQLKKKKNQPWLHYPTSHFILTFSLKLWHQDTFHLNSLWNSGMWNVDWRLTSNIKICTYFWKQNQPLILISTDGPSKVPNRQEEGKLKQNEWDVPDHWKSERAASPPPPTAHSCLLKLTLWHQIIQTWNANLKILSSLNPPLGLTVQSDITSSCHLHGCKTSSHILPMVAHFTGYEYVLPGSEAVKMRGSKMNFWNLSIGAFSPGPQGRKPPAITAYLRRSWRTELIKKLSNELLLCVLCDKMWLYVTCFTNKERRLNEGGFGRRAVSFLKTTVSEVVEELSSAEKPPPMDLTSLTPLAPPGYYNTAASGLAVSRSSICIIKVNHEQLGKIVL